VLSPLRAEKAMQNYQWLPSVRGDLLAKLGRKAEASAEFASAAQLAKNSRERELPEARAAALRSPD
jgi:predicted RNA polymerase sigma factor